MADKTEKSQKRYVFFLGIGLAAFLTTITYFAVGSGKHAGIPFVLAFIAMAFYSKGSTRLKGTAFTFWLFAFLASAMYFPWLFTNWGFNTKVLITPLLLLIMFTIGTTLNIADFAKEFRKPKGIIIGTFLVFTIMPVLGVLAAKLFNIPPEIAAGVILIGTTPVGAAATFMVYLARGNVALSLSVTILAALLNPIVSPFILKIFAGQLMKIDVVNMMVGILNMIILPISVGLICKKIFFSKADWMNKIIPRVSMLSMLLSISIFLALNRDILFPYGLMLIAVYSLCNLLGFIIGYWGSRAAGLSIRDSRTLSIAVSKNGSLGMGLVIANYWRHRPTGDEQETM